MSNNVLFNDLFLRQDTWRGIQDSSNHKVIATGYKNLDKLLLGGWPLSALTELVTQQDGIGELSILLTTMKHYADKDTLCVLLNPPHQPYAPALVNAGISLDNLLIVRCNSYKEWQWAAEQSIRNQALLFAWSTPIQPRYSELRKLQLAATDSQCPAFLFRPPAALRAPSPARLRIALEHKRFNILSVNLHKLSGRTPGTSTDIILGNPSKERIQLNKLPVNIYYPQLDQLNYQLSLKKERHN
jgi:hypothetical protein